MKSPSLPRSQFWMFEPRLKFCIKNFLLRTRIGITTFRAILSSIGQSFQIEPDGYIYVVKALGQFPAVVPIPQPTGYPVKPVAIETGAS